MRFLRIKGIQSRIMLSFSALIFFVIVALLAAAYLLTRSSVNSINRNYAILQLDQKDEKLTTLMTQVDIFSKSVISNSDIQNALRDEAGGSGISMTSIYSEMSNVPTKIVAGAVVFGDNGSVYREIDADVGDSISGSLAEIAAALADTSGELAYVKSAYVDYGGSYGDTFIFLARKIRDTVSFDDLGFMVIAIRESSLWDNFAVRGEIGTYYITDANGAVVSAGDKNLLSQGVEPELGVDTFPGDASQLSGQFVVNHLSNRPSGLIIVNKIPLSELYANFYGFPGAVLIIGLVAILLSGYVSFAISQRITRPISQLAEHMKRVEGGDFDTELALPEHTSEEILELNSVFREMLGSLNDMIERVQVESAREKDAELRALRAQINPHFLYNTLDTVYWMLIERGDYETAELVTKIGDLLRYSIRKGSQRVTLRDELGQMANYLLIEKARYEDKLEYEFDVAEEIRGCDILSFTLQPLIENAVNHGIMSQHGRGKVFIRGYAQGDDLVVEIEDDGSGMTAERIEAVLSTGEGLTDTGHIGIRNVDSRIKQTFGERYGLEIESGETSGTKVTVRFPKLPM